MWNKNCKIRKTNDQRADENMFLFTDSKRKEQNRMHFEARDPFYLINLAKHFKKIRISCEGKKEFYTMLFPW